MPATMGLLTDFGTEDTYVGVMKGVIAGIAPGANVIDVTHSVPPGDVHSAAFQLWKAVRYFPADAIFVIVVDPGVGTARHPIAVSWQGRRLIAPDNGVLSYLLAEHEAELAVELSEPQYQVQPVSTTFHGRDIFAPAGGHLAAGVRLEQFGPALDQLQRIELPPLAVSEAAAEGEVIHVDRFGNLITSIGRMQMGASSVELQPWLGAVAPRSFARASARARVDEKNVLPLQDTFGDVPEGELVAYIGSEGLLEVAVNRGQAAARLQLGIGDPITLNYKEAS